MTCNTITIHPTGRIDATIQPPGSKSITNRALICAALAEGQSELEGVLESEDTQVMVDAIQTLGIKVAWDRPQLPHRCDWLRRGDSLTAGGSLCCQQRHDHAVSHRDARYGPRHISHRRCRSHARATDPGSARCTSCPWCRRAQPARQSLPAGRDLRRRASRRHGRDSWRYFQPVLERVADGRSLCPLSGRTACCRARWSRSPTST